MSIATNGAATDIAFKAITKATKAAGTTVLDATSSSGPSAVPANGQAKESAQVWLAASKTITGLSLDAYDASVQAYLDYAESVATASKATWAIELAQSNTRIVSELAANYSNAARALFNK